MKSVKTSWQRAVAAVHASQLVALGVPSWKISESSFEAQEHHQGSPGVRCLHRSAIRPLATISRPFTVAGCEHSRAASQESGPDKAEIRLVHE